MWWYGGVVAGLLACVVTISVPVGSPTSIVIYQGSTAIALILFLGAALLMPRSVRGIWWTLFAFQGLIILSGTVHNYLVYHLHSTSSPNAADIFNVAAYITVFVALLQLVRRLHPGHDREAWIDATILTIAAASLVGLFIIAPTISEAAQIDAATILALAYPLLDIGVFSVLTLVVVGRERLNPSLTILALSAALFLSADLINNLRIANGASTPTSAWLEAVRLAAIFAMTAAATAPGARTMATVSPADGPVTSQTRMVGLAIGVLIAPILLAVVALQGGGASVQLLAVAAILVIVLALWRIRLLFATIEQQRRLTERVLDSAGDGVIGLDLNGYAQFANLAARRMLRCRESDIVGRRFHDVAHHEHPDGRPFPWIDCPARKLIATGGTGTLADQAYVRRDGTRFPVEVLIAPVIVDGRPVGAVLSFRDVSERSAMDELKRQFISIVSHELRTPLTSIKGSLQLLDSGIMGPVPAEQQNLLTMAVTNSERLGRLVDDILDMERLDAGRMPLKPEVTNAAELAGRAITGIGGAADAAGITLKLDAPGDSSDLLINADPHRMLQVLTNLLGNAIKFSERGATVTVIVSRSDDEIRLAVQDFGRGIPQDQVEHVFERFAQVEASDARRQGGTGLGLPIANELTLRSGGRIEVASEMGEGSTFTVVMPLFDPNRPVVTDEDEDDREDTENLPSSDVGEDGSNAEQRGYVDSVDTQPSPAETDPAQSMEGAR